jgi:hypothetical protein
MELLCPHCSQQIQAEVGDEFCPECGQPISGAGAAPALGPSATTPTATSDPAATVAPTDPATATAAAILQVKVDGRPPVPYTGAPILVGRLDEASGSLPDVPFNDPAISRRHLTIWLDGGRILVQDGSTNGTFRGGLRLPQGSPVELFAGETLTLPGQMGTYSIRVELS